MAFPKLLQRLFQNNGAGDKLNQDIIPDIPYSKITDAPSVDSALSSTSENPVQNKVINSALDEKLSLSGGTMTGDITLTGDRKIMSATSQGGELVINQTGASLHGSKVDWQDGASLLLRSSTYPNDQKGHFYLLASLSSSQNCMLVGSHDGSLTWGGKSLTGGLSVVAESYSANSWYRKYSDGWIEQGGVVSGTASNWKGGSKKVTTTFPVAFSTTPTIATVEVLPSGNSSRTGRLSLRTEDTDSLGDTEYYYGVIEASSTGMSIRVTSTDYSASVTATVYYVVCGK